MRWQASFVALCAIWAIVLGWCWIAVQTERDALFIGWLVLCPSVGFLICLGGLRLAGLPWLGVGSIAIAFGAFLLYQQGWTWDACPQGEAGETCQLERLVVWFAGLYALGVAAAIGVGLGASTALHRNPGTAAQRDRS